jgi:hypothetical protein
MGMASSSQSTAGKVQFSCLITAIVLAFLLWGVCNAGPDLGCYDEKSLTYDLHDRDRLPHSQQSSALSPSQKWGPRAFRYPRVPIPEGCDPIAWQRLRVIAVAKRYIGLPYAHHHIPDWEPSGGKGPGLDCSNFTTWVYNYGLGIHFTSDIHQQSDGPDAPGRRLRSDEAFQPGDLLFVMKKDRSSVSHVVLYVNDGEIIDSHGTGVELRPFKGWYRSHFSHARRIIE